MPGEETDKPIAEQIEAAADNQPPYDLSDEERARRAALEKLSDVQLAELYHALPGRERNNSALAFNLFPIIVAVVGFLLDQYIKFLAVSTFKLNGQVNPSPISIVGDIFTFTYSENDGVAFSMFKGIPWLFSIFSSVIILGLLFVIFRRPRWVASSFWIGLSLGMVLGGATGNLIDRVRQGYVVDMFLFHVADFRFAIFNIADSLVVVGFIILAIYGLTHGWFSNKPTQTISAGEETKP